MNTRDIDIELPEPDGYFYEWDGPYGTRKFTTAPHNGRECNRAVAYYTADQVRDAIEAALKSPEIQELRKDAERYRWLRDVADGDGICVVHADYWFDAHVGKCHCDVYNGAFLDHEIDAEIWNMKHAYHNQGGEE